MRMSLARSAAFTALVAIVGSAAPLPDEAAANAEQGARVVRAVPATLAAVLARAKAGDRIVLSPGDYVGVRLQGRDWAPAVTVDASAATLAQWSLQDVSGLSVVGGEWRPGDAPTGSTASLKLTNVSRFRISDARFVGPGRREPAPVFGNGKGVVLNGGKDFRAENLEFVGLRNGLDVGNYDGFVVRGVKVRLQSNDGITIALSRNGLIEDVDCAEAMRFEKNHADCIQMWSRPKAPPTADITIRRVTVKSSSQGIAGFNHVRNGVDDGGFDRIVIEDSVVETDWAQAVALNDARDSIIRRVTVRTAPGARHRASLNTRGDVRRCGNVVHPGAGKPGVKDPPCTGDR